MLLVNRIILFEIIMFLLMACTNQSYKKINYSEDGKIESIINYRSKSDSLNYTATYYKKNGALLCKGTRINGEKSGKWYYYNDYNKIISIENFCNGLLCDTQVDFHSDGVLDRYRILDQPIPCFCDTQLHYGFKQVAYYRNGQLREINHIKSCQFNGRVKLFDSLSNRLYEEFDMVNDVKHGKYFYYNPDSSIIKGFYKNGKESGSWVHILKDSIIDKWEY